MPTTARDSNPGHQGCFPLSKYLAQCRKNGKKNTFEISWLARRALERLGSVPATMQKRPAAIKIGSNLAKLMAKWHLTTHRKSLNLSL